MRPLFTLAILIVYLTLSQSASAADCVNLDDAKQTTSLATVEMKRHIPWYFQHLTENIAEKSSIKSKITFSVSENNMPDNIIIATSSGNTAIDKAAIEAIQQAAPYRPIGGCYAITLTFTPSENLLQDEPKAESKQFEPGLTLTADRSIRDQIMKLGAGDDTYYYSDTMEGMDIIDDSSGKADSLVFGKKKLSEAQIKPISSDPQDRRIDSLMIDFGDANSVTIFNYFDDSAISVKDVKAGPGLIEKIVFAGGVRLSFENIKAKLKDKDFGTIINQEKILQQYRIQQKSQSLRAHQSSANTVTPSSQRTTYKGYGSLPRPASITSGPTVRTPSNRATDALGNRSGKHIGPTMLAGSPTQYGDSSSVANSRTESPTRSSSRTGIDASEDTDFGPYVSEIQRRIRRNFAPPNRDPNQRVVALFHISRDGRLLTVSIQQSSGSPPTDQAAIAAIRASAPFRALPASFKGNDISVQFIFDSQIPGHGSARLR